MSEAIVKQQLISIADSCINIYKGGERVNSMIFRSKTYLISAALIASTLTACVTPTGPVDVTRFVQESEFEQVNGQYVGSFAFDNSDSSLSLTPYRAAISREMQRLGFTATDDAQANYIISINVDRYDSERPKDSNVSVGGGASTGSFGSGVGLGLGINLSGRKKRTHTELSTRISKNGTSVWEGRALQSAKTGSPAAQEGIAASKLASSLFLGFPGRSGETIEVE